MIHSIVIVALTRPTIISTETNQAHVRVFVHTMHAGTTNETACVILTIVYACSKKDDN